MSGEPGVRITSYRDGPLLVRGPFELVDQDGETIEVGRGTVALCRCGRSRMRPFCDGSHALVRFSAPSGREDRRPAAAPHRPAA
jgi:CDGSH-type Zn-finger protein